MTHEYQRHRESSHMLGADTKCKTFLESHGWNNFVFPCMIGLFSSSGQYSSPQWATKKIQFTSMSYQKYNQKWLLTPSQQHLTLVPSSVEFHLFLQILDCVVTTFNPWALWPGASRSNLAQNSNRKETAWNYFCPPFSLLETHARLNTEYSPSFYMTWIRIVNQAYVHLGNMFLQRILLLRH